jgi:alpha-N-acetylglucosamine transferase
VSSCIFVCLVILLALLLDFLCIFILSFICLHLSYNRKQLLLTIPMVPRSDTSYQSYSSFCNSLP